MEVVVNRKYYLKDLDKVGPSGGPGNRDGMKPATPELGNLVSSELDTIEDLHAPVLDIDVPARLIRSSTPGHFHLYIDVPMTWDRYAALLGALFNAGIIELGYYQASMATRASFLRKPGITKGELLSQAQQDLLELSTPTSQPE